MGTKTGVRNPASVMVHRKNDGHEEATLFPAALLLARPETAG